MRTILSTGLLLLLILPGGTGLAAEEIKVYSVEKGAYVMSDKIEKSESEWRDILTAEQFHVLREEGTESPFSGKYHDHHGEGVYACAGCGIDLFSSEAKYDSGTGWPSFTEPVDKANIGTKKDRRLFTVRTEVHCARCGGHLGHVFEDGPEPTGLRYCLNSAALQFEPSK